MNKNFTLFFVGILFLIGVTSCCNNPNSENTKTTETSIAKEVLPIDHTFENTKEMLDYSRQFITEASSKKIDSIMKGEDEYYLIDVRTGKENDVSYIPGAISIPRGVLEFRIASEDVWDNEGLYMPTKESIIIIYCKSGDRSTFASKTLAELGYTNVVSLKGGFNQWKKDYPKNIYVNVVSVAKGAAPAVQEEDGGGC